MSNLLYVQAQPFSLAGSGVVVGATTMVLASMKDINGTNLAMSDFGAKGYFTLEPGNGVFEEAGTFTGLVQNANGTCTVSGVSTILFKSPYTETSGLAKNHAGGVSLIITDSAGFWSTFPNKQNTETITAAWTYDSTTGRPKLSSDVDTAVATEFVDFGQLSRQAIAGAANASTTVKGLVQEATQVQMDAGTTSGSTGADLFTTPGLIRSKLLSDYVVDTGAADAYVITPSPAIAAYATGQIFSFKALHANTTASTINVNGKGVKSIVKLGGSALVANDITAGLICLVEYDGTNFQLLNPVGNPPATLYSVQNTSYVYAATTGSANAYVLALTPAIAAYVTGQVFYAKANFANTGAATIAVNGLSAISIKKNGATALASGDIANGQEFAIMYDGTNFQMLSPVGNTTLYTNGSTNRAGNSGAGTQTIAHGLGKIPSFVSITAFKGLATNLANLAFSQGSYNGTTSTNIYYVTRGSQPDCTIGTGPGVYIADDPATNAYQAAITWDATNIILTWTVAAGTPSAPTIQMTWEAIG